MALSLFRWIWVDESKKVWEDNFLKEEGVYMSLVFFVGLIYLLRGDYSRNGILIC